MSEVEVLRVLPDDVLVLTAPGHISAEAAEEFMKKLKILCPKNRSLVLGDGLSLSVLRPGEKQAGMA